MRHLRRIVLTIGFVGISALLAAGCGKQGQAEEPKASKAVAPMAPEEAGAEAEEAGAEDDGDSFETKGTDPCGGNPRGNNR